MLSSLQQTRRVAYVSKKDTTALITGYVKSMDVSKITNNDSSIKVFDVNGKEIDQVNESTLRIVEGLFGCDIFNINGKKQSSVETFDVLLKGYESSLYSPVDKKLLKNRLKAKMTLKKFKKESRPDSNCLDSLSDKPKSCLSGPNNNKTIKRIKANERKVSFVHFDEQTIVHIVPNKCPSRTKFEEETHTQVCAINKSKSLLNEERKNTINTLRSGKTNNVNQMNKPTITNNNNNNGIHIGNVNQLHLIQNRNIFEQTQVLGQLINEVNDHTIINTSKPNFNNIPTQPNHSQYQPVLSNNNYGEIPPIASIPIMAPYDSPYPHPMQYLEWSQQLQVLQNQYVQTQTQEMQNHLLELQKQFEEMNVLEYNFKQLYKDTKCQKTLQQKLLNTKFNDNQIYRLNMEIMELFREFNYYLEQNKEIIVYTDFEKRIKCDIKNALTQNTKGNYAHQKIKRSFEKARDTIYGGIIVNKNERNEIFSKSISNELYGNNGYIKTFGIFPKIWFKYNKNTKQTEPMIEINCAFMCGNEILQVSISKNKYNEWCYTSVGNGRKGITNNIYFGLLIGNINTMEMEKPLDYLGNVKILFIPRRKC